MATGKSPLAAAGASWQTLGDMLRAAREANFLSLPELQARTKIPQKYLAAIETGNRQALPARPFARGFVDGYAQAVGLDRQAVLDAYDRLDPRPDVIGVQAAVSLRRPPVAITARTLIVSLVVVGLAAIAYWPVYQVQRFIASQPPGATGGPSGTPGPAPTSVYALANSPLFATATALPESTPTPTATPIRGVHLQVRLKEDSWLCVIVDERLPDRMLARAGTSYRWDGNDKIFLRTGNAGGTEGTFNGKNEGPLGAHGDVKNFQWTAADSPARLLTPTTQFDTYVQLCSRPA